MCYEACAENEILNSGFGDKVSFSTYGGDVTGTEGSLGTIDASSKTTNNGFAVEGGSVSLLNVVALGCGFDGSLSVGVPIFGGEVHLGVDIADGIGVSIGGSTTDKGKTTGGDY